MQQPLASKNIPVSIISGVIKEEGDAQCEPASRGRHLKTLVRLNHVNGTPVRLLLADVACG